MDHGVALYTMFLRRGYEVPVDQTICHLEEILPLAGWACMATSLEFTYLMACIHPMGLFHPDLQDAWI